MHPDCYSRVKKISKKNIISVMEHSKKDKSTRVNLGLKKTRKLNAPISLEDFIVKELPLSLEDGDICELSVITNPTNEDSTRIKRKIFILNHPKNMIEVLRARLVIAQGLTGNNITMGTN